MTEWTAGYVGDIEYMPGFYREQGPAHLDLACVIGGVQPPDRLGGLGYCELGCGQGLTVLILAAANPDGHFVGIDFNPAHIARGRALAAAAGLTNVELIEASFASLLEPGGPDLPPFDYVTLHGVYSWISAGNRQAIVRFLTDHVRPGGLVYVSYNAMPGWMMGLPLQRLIYEFAGAFPARSDRMVEGALAFVGAMQKAGARAIPGAEMVERLEREAGGRKISYLAHEYLNAHWQPLYHADVARDLADAKLTYVASASLLENYPELTLSAAQRDLISGLPDETVRETLKDYFVARTFRRDVFVRGARRLAGDARERLLARLPLAPLLAPGRTTLDVTVPIGEAKLEERLYRPAFEALAERDVTPAQILDLPAVRGHTGGTALELVGMLAGTGQAVPAPSRGAAPAPARRFNQAVVAQALEQGLIDAALAAPVAASGLRIGLFEMLAYGALVAGAPTEAGPLAEAAWRMLEARGDKLRKDGQPIESREENLDVLRREFATVLAESVPIWRRLGAL